MPAFGKEVIEFGSTGLREILAETKDLEKQVKSTTKATQKLNKAFSSGQYLKTFSQYERARKELAAVRKEQELLTKAFQKQQLVQKYGRFGAFAATNYGATLATARIAGRIGSSGLGVAATLGAPLAFGTLAARGFSGTA